jgi:pimeloyl-ACP methyl ester carboxylesterase
MSMPFRRPRSGQNKPSPTPFAPVDERELVQAPNAFMLMLEARAPWEFAATLATTPLFPRLANLPAGDSHPVVVFPGLGATDFSTALLRKFIRERGYTPYAWEQGFNFGPRNGVLQACRNLVKQTADKHGEKVSLVGWSLGGIYAREMAKEMPELARCVITLGTPFTGHPRATNAWRFYELVSGQSVHDPALTAQVRVAPACPTTSIYSKTDGIVAWQCSINEAADHTENIEVHASHVGMGLNPLALYAVADRLSQHPQRWQKFDLQGARRWFYKTPPAPQPAAPAAPQPPTQSAT